MRTTISMLLIMCLFTISFSQDLEEEIKKAQVKNNVILIASVVTAVSVTLSLLITLSTREKFVKDKMIIPEDIQEYMQSLIDEGHSKVKVINKTWKKWMKIDPKDSHKMEENLIDLYKSLK